jgi:hypothetical protein
MPVEVDAVEIGTLGADGRPGGGGADEDVWIRRPTPRRRRR